MTANIEPQAKNANQSLKWIDDAPLPINRPPEEFELIGQRRNFKDAIIKKSRENLLVPVGLLATTACLTLGLVNLKRGNSRNQQFFMRGRVGAQAFTFVAMAVGLLLTGAGTRSKKDSDE